jgi:hypothetical protein
MARVKRTSIISGVTRTLELKKYDQVEFERRLHSVSEGKLSIDEAFPDISQQAKDFIVYGTTKDEWNNSEYLEGFNSVPLPIHSSKE